MGQELKVGNAVGKLNNFIVEPFLAHKPDEEFYVRYMVGGVVLCEVYGWRGCSM